MQRIAAAYIRVSTEDQTEYSPAAQLRELRTYADAHELLLDERHIYADEGLSGRRAEKRPAFQRMIADAKEHCFSVVLVHKFDRFARSREDSVVYKAILKRAGVEVVSIREPLAEGSYSGVMEAIYESFAEAYSVNLSQEVKKGMTEKALRGEVQTPPPFGYRLENHGYLPEETEAPVVREMFRRCAAGEGFFQIARWLNDMHVTTHRGSAFENRTVEYILRNPVYIGKLRWNPTGRTRRNFTDPNLLIVDAAHKPLVSTALWQAVQQRIAESKARQPYRARPASGRKHWLCGIVRCAACGATLVCSGSGYLRCNNYIRGRCQASQHIPAELLAAELVSRLQTDLRHAARISYRLTPSCPDTADRQNLQKARLRRAEQKLSRLTEAYLNGVLSLEEYKRLKPPLEEEIAGARTAAEAAPEETPAESGADALRAGIEAALETLAAPASTAEKYEAANAVIERCVFDKSRLLLTVVYRISL